MFDAYGFAIRSDDEDEHRSHDYCFVDSPVQSARLRDWDKMLRNWDEYLVGAPPRIAGRLRQGVPRARRGLVWKKLLGSDALRSNSSFDYQATVGRLSTFFCDNGLRETGGHDTVSRLSTLAEDCVDEGRARHYIALRQILLDTGRTFPSHRLFIEDDMDESLVSACDINLARFGGCVGSSRQRLLYVLAAYERYNPGVGYCQGMSFIAAMLLMQMEEEDAFWCLASLFERPKYLLGFFDCALSKMHLHANIFKELLHHHLPELSDHLDKNNVYPLIYLTPWFMTLFTGLPCWESVLAIWDLLLLEGITAICRVAIAIMHVLSAQLLACDDMPSIVRILQRVPVESAKPTEIISAVWSFEVHQWELGALQNLLADRQQQMKLEKQQAKKEEASTPATNRRSTRGSSQRAAPYSKAARNERGRMSRHSSNAPGTKSRPMSVASAGSSNPGLLQKIVGVISAPFSVTKAPQTRSSWRRKISLDNPLASLSSTSPDDEIFSPPRVDISIPTAGVISHPLIYSPDSSIFSSPIMARSKIEKSVVTSTSSPSACLTAQLEEDDDLDPQISPAIYSSPHIRKTRGSHGDTGLSHRQRRSQGGVPHVRSSPAISSSDSFISEEAKSGLPGLPQQKQSAPPKPPRRTRVTPATHMLPPGVLVPTGSNSGKDSSTKTCGSSSLRRSVSYASPSPNRLPVSPLARTDGTCATSPVHPRPRQIHRLVPDHGSSPLASSGGSPVRWDQPLRPRANALSVSANDACTHGLTTETSSDVGLDEDRALMACTSAEYLSPLQGRGRKRRASDREDDDVTEDSIGLVASGVTTGARKTRKVSVAFKTGEENQPPITDAHEEQRPGRVRLSRGSRVTPQSQRRPRRSIRKPSMSPAFASEADSPSLARKTPTKVQRNTESQTPTGFSIHRQSVFNTPSARQLVSSSCAEEYHSFRAFNTPASLRKSQFSSAAKRPAGGFRRRASLESIGSASMIASPAAHNTPDMRIIADNSPVVELADMTANKKFSRMMESPF